MTNNNIANSGLCSLVFMFVCVDLYVYVHFCSSVQAVMFKYFTVCS